MVGQLSLLLWDRWCLTATSFLQSSLSQPSRGESGHGLCPTSSGWYNPEAGLEPGLCSSFRLQLRRPIPGPGGSHSVGELGSVVTYCAAFSTRHASGNSRLMMMVSPTSQAWDWLLRVAELLAVCHVLAAVVSATLCRYEVALLRSGWALGPSHSHQS